MKIAIKIDPGPARNYLKATEARIKRGLPGLVNRSAQAIKSDISKGIRQGIDIHGQPFTPLSPSTIHSKRARGNRYPRRALFAAGTMQNVYLAERATPGKLRARLIMPLSRQQIGQYHNEGTGPYTITPKSKAEIRKVLMSDMKLYDCDTADRGRKYFARIVHHPGLPKREWFGISERVKSVIFRLQEQFFQRIIRES